jgi:hypothetical protein
LSAGSALRVIRKITPALERVTVLALKRFSNLFFRRSQMVENVDYEFKVGASFLVEVLPPKNDMVGFNVMSVCRENTIYAGFLKKNSGGVKREFKFEHSMDDVPDGTYKILLEKVEE